MNPLPSAMAATLLAIAPSLAAPAITLTLRDHRFEPEVLTLPADTKVVVLVRNAGAVAAEFESAELNREKVVPAGGEVRVIVGPLAAGSYGFFDDFHPDTKGRFEVKP